MHATKFVPVLLVLLAPCAVLGGAAEANAVEPKRLNIVFVFSDDHAYQAISAYGSKVSQTPNIDRLGKEGAPDQPPGASKAGARQAARRCSGPRGLRGP